MQPNEVQLELALDLYRAGVDQPTHMLLATAHNLVSEGWTKGIALINPIEAVYPVGAESAIPDSSFSRSPSTQSKMMPLISARTVSPGGIQWGSEWVDPDNMSIPDRGMERRWSGWQGLNENQRWVMTSLSGEKGRYTLGVQAVTRYIKKHGGDPKTREERKHVKPHYLMHSLSRRGLITELDKDVWILTTRGQLYVREVLRMDPTPKHDSVQTVA